MNLRALALAGLLAAALAGPVAAQPAKPPAGLPPVAFDAPPLERQDQAVRALDAWVQSAAKDGTPYPRVSDPGLASQLFKAVFNKEAIAAAPPDGARLNGMCTVARLILTVYLRQGIAADAVKPGEAPPKAVIDQMTANAVRFQPESAMVMDFTLDCSARIATMASQLWATMPPSKRAEASNTKGVAGLQGELLNLYRGGVGTVIDPTFGAPLRTTVLTAMNRNVAVYAETWTPDQRTRLTAEIDAGLKTATPAYAPGLTKLRETIANAPCTGLCAG